MTLYGEVTRLLPMKDRRIRFRGKSKTGYIRPAMFVHKKFADTFYIDWNSSTNTVDIFETSNDVANWGTKYIMIELFHDSYSGGGYAKYFWSNQYNINTLTQV